MPILVDLKIEDCFVDILVTSTLSMEKNIITEFYNCHLHLSETFPKKNGLQ